MASPGSKRDFLPPARRDLLARLLCNLARRGWKGTLHLKSGPKHWSITLAGHRIRGIDLWNGEDLRLGRILTQTGDALLRQTDRAADLARRQCRLAGQVLTEQGLPEPMLAAALRKQARQRFARFLEQAHGKIHLEPNASLPVRASLGRPLDLGQALMQWARPAEPPPGPNQDRLWILRGDHPERLGEDLARILPPELAQLVGDSLLEGRISWERIKHDILQSPALGSSFLETLWAWLAVLERLGLALSAPAPSPAAAGTRQTERPATTDGHESRSRATGKGTTNRRQRGETGRDRNATKKESRARARLAVEATNPVPKGDDPAALRRWWHEMARRYHPDSNPDADPEAFHRAHQQYLAALAKRNEQA